MNKLIDIQIDEAGNITFVVAGMVRHGSLAALADALYDRPVRNAPQALVVKSEFTQTIAGSCKLCFKVQE